MYTGNVIEVVYFVKIEIGTPLVIPTRFKVYFNLIKWILTPHHPAQSSSPNGSVGDLLTEIRVLKHRHVMVCPTKTALHEGESFIRVNSNLYRMIASKLISVCLLIA